MIKFFVIVGVVSFNETVEHLAAIIIKCIFQPFHSCPCQRKVKVYHLESVLQRSGMLFYPQSVEQRIEAVRLGDVIVIPHHADEHALAETARTDKEKILACIFQKRKIHRFVYIIEVFVPYFFKTCHTVRDNLSH